MQHVSSVASLAGAVLLLAVPAAADVIHVPGEQPHVAAAVAVAVDGDVILVTPGNYPQLIAIDGLGISIVGTDGVPFLRSITVRNIPAGDSVLLQNLQVGPMTPTPLDDNDAITLLDCAGAVRIESCSATGVGGHSGTVTPFLLPVDGGAGLRLVNCQDVVVLHGTLLGGGGGTLADEDFQISPSHGGPAATVRSSRVAFFDVDLQGGDGGNVEDTVTDSGGNGGEGLVNETGVVHASGCTLSGGNGGWGDCDFFIGFCGSGGLGGDAIRQYHPVATISLRDNILDPGSGGLGGDGTPAPDGALINLQGGSVQTYDPVYRDLSVTSSVAEGEHEVLTVTGLPGDLVILVVSLAPGWLEKPALDGLYTVAGPFTVPTLGVITGTTLTLDALVPELGPGLTHLVGRVQLVTSDAGGVHLGPSATVVLLDSAE